MRLRTRRWTSASCSGRGRFGLGVVEAQVVGRDERAGLADVFAEHVAEGGVEQVGGGVVAGRVGASGAVDLGLDLVADGELSGGDFADVGDHVAEGAGLGDFELRAVGGDGAGVADLAAAFGVEGRGVEDDADLVAGRGVGDRLAVADDRGDLGAGCDLVVAGEGRGEVQLSEGGGLGVAAEFGGLACAVLLIGEGGLESLDVEGQACGFGDCLSQFAGDAVGVVEDERFLAGDAAGGGAGGASA